MVFILAADTGVTRPDLAIWREHLAVPGGGAGTGALGGPEQNRTPVGHQSGDQGGGAPQRQRATAVILEMPPERVLAIRAKRPGGKITGDDACCVSCGSAGVKDAGRGIMGQRQAILR